MYCNYCGKQNSEQSKFCRFCGAKIIDNDSEEPSTKASVNDMAISNFELIWSKLVEIYEAEGAKKEKFDALSSNEVFEILNRLSTNAFENFIKDNKDELNKQPYKTITELKTYFIWVISGGYKLSLAEALVTNSKLNKIKAISLDKFIACWEEYDFDFAIKNLSDDMDKCITKYVDYRMDNFMETVPEAQNLTTETVHKLRTSWLLQTLNGYHAFKIENTFRK